MIDLMPFVITPLHLMNSPFIDNKIVFFIRPVKEQFPNEDQTHYKGKPPTFRNPKSQDSK